MIEHELKITEKRYVEYVSFENLIGDFEIRTDSIERNLNSELQVENIKRHFDKTTQKVIDLLIEGYNFHEISKMLNLKTHKVYQIKHNLMRKVKWFYREQPKFYTDDGLIGLLVIYFMCFGVKSTAELKRTWADDKVLSEYPRPFAKKLKKSRNLAIASIKRNLPEIYKILERKYKDDQDKKQK